MLSCCVGVVALWLFCGVLVLLFSGVVVLLLVCSWLVAWLCCSCCGVGVLRFLFVCLLG